MSALRPEVRRVALIVAAAFFMQNLDTSIMNTSLPQMARSFGVLPLDLSVGITVYMITAAALIPLSGWLADRLGARRVFLGAIALFTSASLLCGLAQHLWQFALARVLQGVGGALMTPVGRTIVLRNAEKSELLEATAFLIWPALAAPILGPALGGFITTYITWRWNFLLNIPLGLLGMWLTLRFVRATPPEHEHAFDWHGMLLSSGALVALLYGLEGISHAQIGWTAWQWLLPILVIAAGLLCAILSVRHFHRTPRALLELSVVSVPTFRVMALTAGVAFRITTNATPYLLPLLFQIGFGLNALAAGSFVLVYFVGNLGIKPLTTPILKYFGFRKVLLVNGCLAGLSVASCALFSMAMAKLLILITLLVAGATRSMQLTCVNTLAFADTAPRQRSSASTLFAMTNQASAALGVAVGTLVVNLTLLGEGRLEAGLREIRIGLLSVGLIGVASALACLRLPAHAGAEVSGHQRTG
ncbi:MAG: MFS transporter [Steroidobacteraceae bacterium]